MNAPPDLLGPASQFYVSQRLRLHYLDWGNQDKPLLLLIHGGRDHAHNWDWVARELRSDYHIVAPDLRGHGDSAWAIGGMYTQSDFVLDMVQLLEAVNSYPVRILGHSLGGAVSLQYSGTYPEKVCKLIAIEGLLAPPEMLARRQGSAPSDRMRYWIETMKDLARRQPKRYDSVEAAAHRMQEANRHLSMDQARHLTVHGVARNEDGTYSWKFDNYIRALGALPVQRRRSTLDLGRHHLSDDAGARHRELGVRPRGGRPHQRVPARSPGQLRESRPLGAPRSARTLPRGDEGVSRRLTR